MKKEKKVLMKNYIHSLIEKKINKLPSCSLAASIFISSRLLLVDSKALLTD